jgi:hypothetical protein
MRVKVGQIEIEGPDSWSADQFVELVAKLQLRLGDLVAQATTLAGTTATAATTTTATTATTLSEVS